MTKAKVLKELEDYIKEFNTSNDLELSYDTIRINFSKQHKLKKINALGNWKKINKSNSVPPPVVLHGGGTLF